jgi:hypothetical protein
MSRTALVGLAAALLVAGAGCGGDDDTSAGAPTTVATTTTTTAVETTSTTVPTAPTTAPAPTTTVAPRPPTTSDTPDTPDTRGWGTTARDDPTMSPDDLYQVRVGRHGSYDRIVFDVNGTVDGPDVVGYHVAYVDGEVLADASGEPVPTEGPASLEIVIRAPWLGTGGSGHQPWREPPTVGDDLVPAAQLRGWTTMRQVAFAGSFEGQTTIAVGVSAELPFRVGAFERDGYSHVYVDIGHPR